MNKQQNMMRIIFQKAFWQCMSYSILILIRRMYACVHAVIAALLPTLSSSTANTTASKSLRRKTVNIGGGSRAHNAHKWYNWSGQINSIDQFRIVCLVRVTVIGLSPPSGPTGVVPHEQKTHLWFDCKPNKFDQKLRDFPASISSCIQNGFSSHISLELCLYTRENSFKIVLKTTIAFH